MENIEKMELAAKLAYEGIKDILTNSLTKYMPDVEQRCLQLLEKHVPDFVNDWKEKENTNTEGESNEPKQPN